MNGPSVQFGQGNSSTNSNTFGISNLGNTSGTTGVISGPNVQLLLAGGNNVTLSQSINGSSATITISAYTQTVQTQNLVALSLSGNTAGALALISSGTAILAGGDNITLSQNGQSVSIIGPAPTAGLAVSLSGNTSGVLADISTGTFYLAGGNRITLSQNANSVTVVGASEGTRAIGISTNGNTAGTTGFATSTNWRMAFVGGNSITLSQSINGASHTITIVGPTQTAESNTLGISNLGNTSGTSGVISGNQLQLALAGGNNITLSQSIDGSSATITISAFTQTVQTQNMVAVSLSGNTAGAMVLISSGTMNLAGGDNITLSQNGQSVTIVGATAAGGGGSSFSEYMPYRWVANTTNPAGAGEAWLTNIPIGGASSTTIYGFSLPYSLSASILNQVITLQHTNASNNNSSRGWSLSLYAGLYTRNDGTLSLITSGSVAYTTTVSSNAWTTQGTATAQVVSLPISLNIPSGLYYLAVAYLTSSTRTNIFTNVGRRDFKELLFLNTDGGAVSWQPGGIGANIGAFVAPTLWGAASTRNIALGVGSITGTNSTSISGSIAISNIRTIAVQTASGQASNNPFFHFNNGTVAQT